MSKFEYGSDEQMRLAKEQWTKYGFFIMHSDILHENIVISSGKYKIPEKYKDLVVYRAGEAKFIAHKDIDPKELASIHKVKKVFKGTVLKSPGI